MERTNISFDDVLKYIQYGELIPYEIFKKEYLKNKYNHTSGVGWAVFGNKKVVGLAENSAVWFNDKGEPKISFSGIFSKSLSTTDLENFEKIDGDMSLDLIAILWIERIFEVS